MPATNAIQKIGVPMLCIDTCSILDIMRDPTREGVRPLDRQAALDVVSAAEAGRIECRMAEQVSTEFLEHDKVIQNEASEKLIKFQKQINQINDLIAIYGTKHSVDVSHFDDHVVRARDVVERWMVQLKTIIPSPSVPGKAFTRMNACLAPARRGKDSSKDCLIYETVLENVAELRRMGNTAPVVFLSSNTKEYYTDGSVLNSDIASDFNTYNMAYAPNMSAARHFLGL